MQQPVTWICLLGTFALLTLLLTAPADANRGQRKCQYRCPQEERIVWAADGQQCYVLRNRCAFNLENCRRVNGPALKIVPRWECFRLCRRNCPRNYDPICASSNGIRQPFINRCLLESQMCITGRFWNILGRGLCP